MKIAVVGATGNIGYRLCCTLLAAGHQVRALSRGGPKLDELVALGAEPFIGSFDEGSAGVEDFFKGVDAAFTMVKSDWSNWLHHYPAVAERLYVALQQSSVGLIVNLSSFGGDVDGETGHSYCFYQLKQALNRLTGRRIVHLRAGWFMENFFGHFDNIARFGRMPGYFAPSLKLPFVATRDVADAAAAEFLAAPAASHSVREVAAEELTMPDVAELIAREIGRDVAYVHVSMDRSEICDGFVNGGFGTIERWRHNVRTYGAMDQGVVRFRTQYRPTATTMREFVHQQWAPAYREALARTDERGDDFFCWLAKHA
jgi:uncharacterized protein YbjT (DUF2867 family)